MIEDEWLLPLNSMIGLVKNTKKCDIKLNVLKFHSDSKMEFVSCPTFEFKIPYQWCRRSLFDEDVDKIQNFCKETDNMVYGLIYGWRCLDPFVEGNENFIGKKARIYFDLATYENTDCEFPIQMKPKDFPVKRYPNETDESSSSSSESDSEEEEDKKEASVVEDKKEDKKEEIEKFEKEYDNDRRKLRDRLDDLDNLISEREDELQNFEKYYAEGRFLNRYSIPQDVDSQVGMEKTRQFIEEDLSNYQKEFDILDKLWDKGADYASNTKEIIVEEEEDDPEIAKVKQKMKKFKKKLENFASDEDFEINDEMEEDKEEKEEKAKEEVLNTEIGDKIKELEEEKTEKKAEEVVAEIQKMEDEEKEKISEIKEEIKKDKSLTEDEIKDEKEEIVDTKYRIKFLKEKKEEIQQKYQISSFIPPPPSADSETKNKPSEESIPKNTTTEMVSKYPKARVQIIEEEEDKSPKLPPTTSSKPEVSEIVMKNGRPIKIKGKDLFPRSKKSSWDFGYHHGDDFDSFGNKQTMKSITKNRNKALKNIQNWMSELGKMRTSSVSIENGNISKYVDDLRKQTLQEVQNLPTLEVEFPDINDYIPKTNWKKEYNKIRDKVFDDLAKYEYTIEDTPEAKENLMMKAKTMIDDLIDNSNYLPQDKEMLKKQGENLIQKDDETGKVKFNLVDDSDDSDSDSDDISTSKKKRRKELMKKLMKKKKSKLFGKKSDDSSDSDSDDIGSRRKQFLKKMKKMKKQKEKLEKETLKKQKEKLEKEMKEKIKNMSSSSDKKEAKLRKKKKASI